jgi:hypothetical protein
MENELNSDETEKLIIELLQVNKQMTTTEIKNKISSMKLKCADDPAQVLSKLKYKGQIQSKLSIKARGYIWWI